MQHIDYTKRAAHILKSSQELVDDLLAINTNNRTVRQIHVDWLKKSIADKKFILTGQGICVSKEGNLIDGQHRLMAIRDAGYPSVDLLVVTGLDEESKIYVDQHSKRSVTDMLKIVLNQNISNKMSATITSRLKINLNEDNEFVFRKGSTNRVDLKEVIDEMNKYSYELAKIIESAGNLPRAGVLAAYLEYATRVGLDDALDLIEQVRDGEHLSKDDPAYRLRAFLLGESKRKHQGSAGQLEDYKNAISACVAHAAGEKLVSLRPSQNWDKLRVRPKQHVVRQHAVRKSVAA